MTDEIPWASVQKILATVKDSFHGIMLPGIDLKIPWSTSRNHDPRMPNYGLENPYLHAYQLYSQA